MVNERFFHALLGYPKITRSQKELAFPNHHVLVSLSLSLYKYMLGEIYYELYIVDFAQGTHPYLTNPQITQGFIVTELPMVDTLRTLRSFQSRMKAL